MVKILMVGNDSSVKGGITTVINQILDYDWSKCGVEIKFIPTYIEKNKVKQILFFIRAYLIILFSLMSYKPNLMHIHMSYKGSFTRANLIKKLCDLFKTEYIIHLHGSEFEKWYNSCNGKKQRKIKKMLKESRKFIVLGNEWKQKIYNIESYTNIVVVSNAVSVSNERAKWNNDDFKFLFLGVLIQRKGISELFDAVSLLKEKNLKFKVIIAGTGEQEKKLKEKCRELNIEKYIEFVGWIAPEEKEVLLSSCQAMILPSYNEGLPMSILEAMAHGLPIISTKVGDISSAVDSTNGILIDAVNIEQLSLSIQTMINKSENEWNEMCNSSVLKIESQFSSTTFYDKLKDCYR